MTYRQLTPEERYMLAALRRQGLNQSQIARALARSGRLSVSHETIYRHVWRDKKGGGALYTHLRGARKRRRKRYGAYDSRGRLAGKRMISERPPEVETRQRAGQWEIDTVAGSGGRDCIVSLVERRSGLVLIGKLEDRTTASLNRRVIRLISRDGAAFETVTADNGTEFHDYKGIEARTKALFYFARPYHSRERGSNENANGLIRQYLPKGESMAGLSQHQCNAIARKLNTRPRKELLALEGAPRYLFTNTRTGQAVQDIKKGFRAACLAAGLNDFTFHDLRHTFATRLKEGGADPVTRRDLLGHASTVMTDSYTHSAAETKQTAVDSISPSGISSPLQFPAKAKQPPSAAAVSA